MSKVVASESLAVLVDENVVTRYLYPVPVLYPKGHFWEDKS